MIQRARILLLGFTVPDEIAQKIFDLDPYPAVQTHKFAWSLARALKVGFCNLELASTCPVQSYPLVKKVFFKSRQFQIGEFRGILLGFVNVLAIKHFSRFVACLIHVFPRVWKQKTEWIVVHGVHSPFLLFANFTRLIGCRFAVVLTDPPGVILSTDRLIARYLKYLDAWLLGHLLRKADAVLALAPDLVTHLTPGRPALVFPGILSSSIRESPDKQANGKLRPEPPGTRKPYTVLYAGGLHAAYGIDRLIDAVEKMDDLIQLRLFGRGDQEDRIQRLAKTDARFYYGGFVNEEKLLPELQSADLLINPRPTTEKFSQMSFPSKLIEYLAMGRPVLTTRIKSIPSAFLDHFLFIEDESPEGIRAALLRVMCMPVADREKISESGKEFVQKEFSETAIGEKIAHFMQCIDKSR